MDRHLSNTGGVFSEIIEFYVRAPFAVERDPGYDCDQNERYYEVFSVDGCWQTSQVLYGRSNIRLSVLLLTRKPG